MKVGGWAGRLVGGSLLRRRWGLAVVEPVSGRLVVRSADPPTRRPADGGGKR